MAHKPLDWHFPRLDLAESILDRFAIGATTALTLFAPRRMGKTEFVVQDLLPMAVEQGYIDVYVNFWDRKQDPADSLIVGLTKATARLKRTARIKKALAKLQAFGINTPIVGANVSVSQPNETEKLDVIQGLFDLLLQDGRKLLVALDEVQHLATEDRFEPIVYALRGIIDLNRERVHVLYTGSSRSGLQRLFTRRNAPLFRSSQQIDLPEFGRQYLEYISSVFHAATGRSLDLDECVEAFRLVKKVPYDYRQVISTLIEHGGADIVSLTRSYLSQNSQDEHYEAEWTALKPVDRVVLRFIVDAGVGLYTVETRSQIADQLGLDNIEVATIQNAINRLRHVSLIAPVGQGRYEIEDPYFADWLLKEPLNPIASYDNLLTAG